MNDKNLLILGGIVGAVVGVGVGFALFTERGRRLRAELQPEIEAVIKEAVRLTQMVDEFKSGQPVAHVANTAAAATWPRRAQ
jgi:gas vesicle protein